jgi:ribosomal protein S18 acetylase RimI-like enzyme
MEALLISLSHLGDMEIRMFRGSDQPQLKRLVSEVLDEYGFKLDEEWGRDLENPQAVYVDEGGAIFLLCDRDEIVGSCIVSPASVEEAALRRMYIKSAYRGKGWGQRLLDDALKFAQLKGYRKVFLYTHPAFSNAVGFYKRHGFRETRREEEWIRLERNL